MLYNLVSGSCKNLSRIQAPSNSFIALMPKGHSKYHANSLFYKAFLFHLILFLRKSNVQASTVKDAVKKILKLAFY